MKKLLMIGFFCLFVPLAAQAQSVGGAAPVTQTPEEKAAADFERAKAAGVSADALYKAMEDAKRKQDLLQQGASSLEMDSGTGDKEWTDKQQKEYQENLRKITKQQEILEEAARKEMERETGKKAR